MRYATPTLALACALCFPVLAATAEPPVAANVDFSRQIRPILSDKCFACHGPDEEERQGGFRLDRKESAFGEADSGEHPIVAGDPDASELLARVTETDESMRMPPAETNKEVTAEEVELLRNWIAQGAKWEEHWAFVPPVRPALPNVSNEAWATNAVDRFILARLDREGLKPQEIADRVTLIRRVTLDLTGLPPTLEEVDAFLADKSPNAYERVVDRLLRSPAYGEHMARSWLDAARYGDTHGLHLDNYREMWLYRDWVVDVFNENMPYDQFTIEQLAGDLLPDSTDDQVVATGFNRCHVTTNEGGSIVEEVYVRNVVDRVTTTGTVFMGLTLECTRCHDHKYDPLTMRDFYSLFAFFNSLDGSAMDKNIKDPPPVIAVLRPEQKERLEHIAHEVTQTRQAIEREVASYEYQEPQNGAEVERTENVWIDDAIPEGAQPQGGWEFVEQPVFSGKKASKRTAKGLSQHFFEKAAKPLEVGEGDSLFAYVFLDPDDPPREIMLQWNDGNWNHRVYWGENVIDWGQEGSVSRLRQGELPETGTWVRLEVPASAVGLKAGSKISGWAFTQFDGTVHWDKAGIVSRQGFRSLAAWKSEQRKSKAKGLPKPIHDAILSKQPVKQPDTQQEQRVRDYFVEHVDVAARPIFQPLHDRIAALRTEEQNIRKSAPTTLVFRERAEPKQAYILHRGEYDQPGAEVPRATPAVLPPLAEDLPLNRLGLARWLVSPEHPLTARVAVNRFWLQLFGTGLVKTAEDFGSQGEMPSHAQLLDWLAVEFRESGWNMKEIMKLLVMSSTYRQSSHVTPELVRRDPRNRLLARGPRYRLDAETIRDQALALGGLLSAEMGGPSVKPPQPDGLWFSVGYSGSNTVRFKADEGHDKIHRRTLYTFIKRTAPPPQMSTFDAPSREACTVRRERTNTPLQALLLMNDPQFLEAAKGLAMRVLREGGDSTSERIVYAFRLCTARRPTAAEQSTLEQFHATQVGKYTANLEAARKLIKVGVIAPPDNVDPAELAAWTLVGNVLLNMDEVINKN